MTRVLFVLMALLWCWSSWGGQNPEATLPSGGGNSAVSSASPGGTITSFLEDANLAHRKLFDIAFQTNGTVWVAASDGLYRYDGYRWAKFSVEHGLPSIFIRCVLVTSNQALWVGTDKGAGTFDGKTFTLLGTEKTLAGVSVRRIVEDPDGTIWFCSDTWPDTTVRGGITSYHTGQWRRFDRIEGLPRDHVLNYFRDSQGRQFLMCAETLSLYRRHGDTWKHDLSEPTLVWTMAEAPGIGVMAASSHSLFVLKEDRWNKIPYSFGDGHFVCSTRTGEILAGGRRSNGLMIRQWNGKAFEQVSPVIPTQAPAFEAMREAPDGSIWCVGDGLLARWNRTGGEWSEYAELPPPRFVDSQQRVWFIGQNGAFYFESERFVRVDGLTNSAEMDRAGNVWSWSRDVVQRYRGGLRNYSAEETGLASVQGMAEGATGEIWFYGHDARGEFVVSVFDRERWRARPLPLGRDHHISSAAADPKSGVWLLAARHNPEVLLIHATGDTTETRAFQYGGAMYEAPKLAVDASGVWIYGISGLFHSITGEPNHWKKIEGLAANHVLAAVPHRDGPWFVFGGGAGGQSGFGCVRNGEWTQRMCDVTGFATGTPDGSLCFGAARSLQLVPHGNLRQQMQITLPTGQEVFAFVKDGNEYWMSAKNESGDVTTYRYRPDGVPPVTTLAASSTEVRQGEAFRVNVAGVERFQPRRNGKSFRFSWRFDEASWSEFQIFPEQGLPVSNLKPGGHRLQVRAQDEGGDVESAPVELAFTVLPAPLQTRPWFRPVVIAIFAAILLLAIAATERARKYARTNVHLKLAQYELRGAHDHLEKRVEERTAQLHHEMNARQKAEVQFAAITAERNRMGRELHDTLEQGLAGVSLQLEAAKMFSQEPETANRHLTLASDLLRQSQTEVRRSVRDLRAQLLEKHDLPTAFRSLARQLAEGTALTIHVQTSGAVCRLPALVENNLFRIGQEAVTNALKHSGANRMVIELCYAPSQLTLCIRDNGRGFNESSITSEEGHFGLLGMRERAKRLGGELAVESSSAGTKVEVSLSLPAKLAEVDVM